MGIVIEALALGRGVLCRERIDYLLCCRPPTAHQLLPTAYCLVLSAFSGFIKNSSILF